MDWKYKHFCQRRIFTSAHDEVLEAARRYVSDQLGWQIKGIAEGFEATGSSFAHDVIARFRIEPAQASTCVTVELLVERASSLGFMIVDIGGYYNIQIRKWFEGIQWCLRQSLTPQPEGARAHLEPPVYQANKPAAYIFNGCFVFIAVTFGLYAVFVLVTASVGLLTGHLLMIGRAGSTTMHGVWARIVSAAILLFGAFILWRVKEMSGSSSRRSR